MDEEEDEADLLALAARGDAGACERLLSLYGPLALGLARQRLSRAGYGAAEAEEVVQEVWVALLEQGGRRLLVIDTARGFKPYLSAVVLNAARAWLRSGGRRKARELASEPRRPAQETPDEPLLRGEAREQVSQAIETLELADQLLLRWAYWEGLTYPQIARLARLKEDSVGSALSRARQKLREVMEKGRPGSADHGIR